MNPDSYRDEKFAIRTADLIVAELASYLENIAKADTKQIRNYYSRISNYKSLFPQKSALLTFFKKLIDLLLIKWLVQKTADILVFLHFLMIFRIQGSRKHHYYAIRFNRFR